MRITYVPKVATMRITCIPKVATLRIPPFALSLSKGRMGRD